MRVAPARGPGEEKVLTPEPGHYASRSSRPTARRSSYRKDAGGGLVTSAWSLEPGIYWVPAAGGGKPTLVTRDGVAPQFGAASDRVYFTRYDGGDDKEEAKRIFASVGARRGGNPRAPRERRRDGVRGSRPTRSGSLSASASTPTSLHSSEPARAWTSVRSRRRFRSRASRRTPANTCTGPATRRASTGRSGRELFTRALTDAFAFLAGAPEKLPEHGGKRHRDRLRGGRRYAAWDDRARRRAASSR